MFCKILQGVWPFAIADLVCVALFPAFPEIVEFALDGDDHFLCAGLVAPFNASSLC
jgi:hypothetical protein